MSDLYYRKPNEDLESKVLQRVDADIIAYGSIYHVHCEVSDAICAVKADEREKQLRTMTETQKKEFLEKRSKNVSIGAEIHKELKSIMEQLQIQAPEVVHVSKYDVRRENMHSIQKLVLGLSTF